MKLQQLSLFLENRPGTLQAPTRVLAGAGVNILSVSLADTAQFGILRLIVAEPEWARQVLADAGMVVRVSEVVAVEVEHEPGGLARALTAVEDAHLGVAYMYLFGGAPRQGAAALIFRFAEPDAAVEALTKAGVRVLSREELIPG